MVTFPWVRTPYPIPRPFASFGANNHSGLLDDNYRATNMKRVRLDAAWWQVEKALGVYDLTWTDNLIRPYADEGTTPLVILSANNPVYYTPDERKTLALLDRPWLPYDVSYALDGRREALWISYAYKVIERHAGLGIDWEMMNEIMDTRFWHNLDGSQPPFADTATVYVRIVKALSIKLQANRKTKNEKLVVGAAYGKFDFMEEIFRQGILAIPSVKAVSFHMYMEKGVAPEAAIPRWTALRSLIDRYAAGRAIPMISSEWGYDEESCDAFMTEAQAKKLSMVSGLPSVISDSPWADAQTDIRREIQADLMLRTFQVNYACRDIGLAYSIWYRFPGADQTFGMLDQKDQPKPAFKALVALHKELSDWGL